MFKFFKPKKSCAELGAFFASLITSFLFPGTRPSLDEEFRLFIECGASRHRIRPEMTALQTFACWAAMVVALQKHDMSEQQFEALRDAFMKRLNALTQGFDVKMTGSVSYDSFWNWLEARVDRYINIATTNTDTLLTTKMIVDNFWDYACDGEPSDVLLSKIWQTYETSLLNVAKIIAMNRLTVS